MNLASPSLGSRLPLFITAACLAGAVSLSAATWSGETGDFSEDAKWKYEVPPVETEDVVVTGSGSLTVTQDYSTTSYGVLEINDGSLLDVRSGGTIVFKSATVGGSSSAESGTLQISGGSLKLLETPASEGVTEVLANLDLGAHSMLKVTGGTLKIGALNSAGATIEISGGNVVSEGISGELGYSDLDSLTDANTVDLVMTGGSWNATKRIRFGSEGTSEGSTYVANISGGTITGNGYLIFGYGGTNTILNLSGNGKIIKTGDDKLIFADGAGNTATANLSDNAIIDSTKEIDIGWSGGTATVTLEDSASIKTGSTLSVGRGSGSTGVLVLKGSSSVTGGGVVEIGRDGAKSDGGEGSWGGVLDMRNNSRVEISGKTVFGSGSGTGLLKMTDDTYFQTSNLVTNAADSTGQNKIELSGAAQIKIGTTGEGGTFTYGNFDVYGHLTVETATGSTASISGKDLWLTNGNADSRASLTLKGGSLVNLTGNISIARDSAAGYVLEMSDDSQLIAGGNLAIGQNSNGNGMENRISLSGNAILSAKDFTIAKWYGAGASVYVDDSAKIVANGMVYIGDDASTGKLTMTDAGQFTVLGSGNGLVVGTNLQHGNGGVTNTAGGGTGVVTLENNAALSTESGDIILAQVGNATLTVKDSATVSAGGSGKIIMAQHAGAATLNLQGGVVQAAGFEKGLGTAVLNIGGGTIKATAANADFFSGFDGGDFYFTGALVLDTDGHDIGLDLDFDGAQNSSLLKKGSGELTLEKSAHFAGNVVVEAGTLVLMDYELFASGNEALLSLASGTTLDLSNLYSGDVLDVGQLLVVGENVAQGLYTIDELLAELASMGVTGVSILGDGSGVSINVIPEPSTYGMLGGIGLLGLLVLRRRRRQ